MRKFYALLSLTLLLSLGTSYGEGPRFSHEDPITDREFENVYQDIRSGRASLSSYLPIAGGTMTGSISMSSNFITNVASATLNHHAARFSQVKIIQVVSTTSVTSFATTSSSFVNSNLIGTITPTNSANRIIVFVSGQGTAVAPSTIGYYTLQRGTTHLGDATVGFKAISFANYPVNTNVSVPIDFHYVDSPATTSATTYAVQVRSTSGANNVTFGTSSAPQSMILMEVNGL